MLPSDSRWNGRAAGAARHQALLVQTRRSPRPFNMAWLNWAQMSRKGRLARLLITSLICIGTSAARSQSEMESPKYQDVFYASGSLRIQAYVYQPEGDGPFP